ncbi:hypothetical protein CHM_7g2180 [Cryptosporidium hominis]
MRKKYFDYMEELKLYFGKKDSDLFHVLKEILKRSAREEAILSQCSKYLGTILGLTEVILESFQLNGFTPIELKLLSELSILLGIIRNISTISFENRKIISNSKIFKNLNYFIYIKFRNEENTGLLSLVSYEILKVLEHQSPEGLPYNAHHFNEFLLLSCRFLQILANISIDSDTDYQNLKSSEWIFFFFKHLLSENPCTFRDLYFYKHSEESTIECDASLIYLTMQEPFVKLSMLENNYIDISDAKITKEIIILQKLLSTSIITEHEFKDFLLEICVEIETNPNLKQNVQGLVDKNIISQIFFLDGIFDTILSELKVGVFYLEQFINLQIEYWSLKLKNKNLVKFSISKLGNIKGWISILRISTPKDESNIDFFSKVNISLIDLLRIMLKFRRHLICPNHIIVEEIKATWKLVSEEISMASIIQAISTICYGNVQLQNSFSQNQDGISMLIECTTIVDESHPLLREAAVFSLKSIAINNPKVSEIIMKYGKK